MIRLLFVSTSICLLTFLVGCNDENHRIPILPGGEGGKDNPSKESPISIDKVSSDGCLNIPKLIREASKSKRDNKSRLFMKSFRFQTDNLDSSLARQVVLTSLKQDEGLYSEFGEASFATLWNADEIAQSQCKAIEIPGLLGRPDLEGKYEVVSRKEKEGVISFRKGNWTFPEIEFVVWPKDKALEFSVYEDHEVKICDKSYSFRVERVYWWQWYSDKNKPILVTPKWLTTMENLMGSGKIDEDPDLQPPSRSSASSDVEEVDVALYESFKKSVRDWAPDCAHAGE